MSAVLDIVSANVKLLPMFLLLGGALATLYWKATPGIVKGVLQNGGGEVVRRIVREENDQQLQKTHDALDRVREKLGGEIASVRERMAAVEAVVRREAR